MKILLEYENIEYAYIIFFIYIDAHKKMPVDYEFINAYLEAHIFNYVN